MLSNLLDVIFPPRCLGCEIVLDADVSDPVCGICHTGLRWINGPIGSADIPPGVFDHLTACCRFDGVIAHAIHRFKYEQRPDLARPLGTLLSRCVGQRPAGMVIVPVPLSRRRLRARGYNQAALLAQRVRRQCGGSLATHAVTRRRDTPPQVGLERAARLANLRGAFAVRDASVLRGRDVLLIDDVMTTGATLTACARILRKAGVRRLSALVVAVA